MNIIKINHLEKKKTRIVVNRKSLTSIPFGAPIGKLTETTPNHT